jgi:YggT family protein
VSFLCALVTVYIVIVFARVMLSWFPLRPDTPMASINHVLLQLTEPVMAPLRRVIPPAGMFDLSAMVLIFGLFILRSALCP